MTDPPRDLFDHRSYRPRALPSADGRAARVVVDVRNQAEEPLKSISFTMTPEAAQRLGELLVDAALEAVYAHGLEGTPLDPSFTTPPNTRPKLRVLPGGNDCS